MSSPLISVILPAYNASAFITDAIESVQSQTYANWELIIVNDGSEDNTGEIVERYLTNDVRIKYFYQNNGKQAKARNLAVSKSTGDLLAFLDADDLWLPHRLEEGVRALSCNTEIDLIFSQGCVLSDGIESNYNVIVKPEWNESDVEMFMQSNRIPILSVLMKKEALLSVGGFNENSMLQNAEDYELWIRLLIEGFKFSSIQERLFIYRQHQHQSTFDSAELNRPLFTLFTSLYKIYPNRWFTKELAVRLCGFLPFATFHHAVSEILIDYIKTRNWVKGELLRYSNLLPRNLKNQLVIKSINKCK